MTAYSAYTISAKKAYFGRDLGWVPGSDVSPETSHVLLSNYPNGARHETSCEPRRAIFRKASTTLYVETTGEEHENLKKFCRISIEVLHQQALEMAESSGANLVGSLFGEAEFFPDLLVGEAVGTQLNHTPFGRGNRVNRVLECIPVKFVIDHIVDENITFFEQSVVCRIQSFKTFEVPKCLDHLSSDPDVSPGFERSAFSWIVSSARENETKISRGIKVLNQRPVDPGNAGFVSIRHARHHVEMLFDQIVLFCAGQHLFPSSPTLRLRFRFPTFLCGGSEQRYPKRL